MLIPRTTFFLAILVLLLVTAVTPKILWLSHTRHATGVMAFEGKGNAGEQMPLSYSVISFRVGKDTVWFNGLGNLRLHSGDSIPVRYV